MHIMLAQTHYYDLCLRCVCIQAHQLESVYTAYCANVPRSRSTINNYQRSGETFSVVYVYMQYFLVNPVILRQLVQLSWKNEVDVNQRG